VLRVHASSALEACLRSLENDVLSTLSALGDVRASAAEMTGADAARLLLAGTLGRLLPALQGLHGSDGAHPRRAYEVVAALLGGLSAFSPSGRARIPAYDFIELQATFEGLAQATREILDTHSTPRQRNVPLERCDENFWRAQLRESGIFGREFLLVLAGGEPATLHASIPRAAKVAALDEISDFVQRHLAGVALIPEIRRPRGISLPQHAACFRLDKRSPAWAGVVKQGAIALWLPAGFAQLTPSLLAQEPGLLGG
jgi:type VI secretion system protein ImpJ